jgi:hypothetical protein
VRARKLKQEKPVTSGKGAAAGEGAQEGVHWSSRYEALGSIPRGERDRENTSKCFSTTTRVSVVSCQARNSIDMLVDALGSIPSIAKLEIKI